MDPDRVRAYLQVACAGLGFDIGEIWWSSSTEGGTSTALASFEEKHDEHNSLAISNGKKMRFVQLYTSRSYENRRNQLVTPADEEDSYQKQVNGDADEHDSDNNHTKKKHVLSPLLVDAISKTAQVVWAHTKKQEGLLGRSDMRLQTAVGMPVAVDGSGNMCVVVMFSPNNISSTDDALEYLQSISRSATSTSIPTLLPAFDPKHGLVSLPHHHNTNEMIPLLSSPNMTDGSVITRFVSLDDAPIGVGQLSVAEVHSNHDLANAPKDCFGIPMLPSVPLIDGNDPLSGSDAFDEASYGVWSTIMDTADPHVLGADLLEASLMNTSHLQGTSFGPMHEATAPLYAINKPSMDKERLDRLEEFASAFLDVSVFDFAEVWVPIDEHSDHLGQVTSIVSSSSRTNQALQDFERMSERILVRFWSGAVGRAFSSGNPVWSANPDVIVDSGRSSLFSQVKIETALAVPVFSGKSNTPSFVFSCYSFVRSGSVPFVLKFVQQALRLLWDGLDKVQPHKSVGEDLWKDVAPADLGEMAADVEMQQHFMIKKRPRANSEVSPAQYDPTDTALAMGIQAIGTISDNQPVRSIYTGAGESSYDHLDDEDLEPNYVPLHFPQPIPDVHSQIQQAVQSMSELKPSHQHIATNVQGSKRAHVFIERLDSPVEFESHVQPQGATPTLSHRDSGMMKAPSPLPMPRPLPLPNASLRQPLERPNTTATMQQQIQPSLGQASLPLQHPGQNYRPPQAPSQSYQIQNHQKSHAMFLNVDSNIGHRNYQMQVTQDPQPVFQEQQRREGFGYSSHSQSATESPYTMGYQQQSMSFQNDTQQHQHQQQYHSIQSSEPMSLPQEFNQSADFGAEPRAMQQHVAPAQTNYAAVPNNKISAIGIVFQVPQAQANSNNVLLSNGMGKADANLSGMGQSNGNNADLFCVQVNQGGSSTSSGGQSGKSCRIQGCTEPAVTRRPYCIRHSGNRMCEHAGCGKCAQGSTRFCIAHGGGRRCTFPGCDKGARDKFFCAAHGGGKRCKYDGCNKSAVGGSQLCTAHGGGRRCCIDGCDKSAQSSTKYCVKHGGGKKCAQDGCEKVARGRTQYCAAHGGGVRCKLAGCNRVAIGKVQLCRAHGGGTHSRRSSKTGGSSVTSSFYDDDDDSMDDQNEGIPGFADMASV